MDLPTIGLIIAAAAVIAAFILAVRRPAPVLLDHDTRAHDKLFTPVEHHGADATWSPADTYTDAGDPFTRPLSDIELADSLLFDELAEAYPVRLDWRPPDFTQEWDTLGTVLDQLGQTQPLPRIEVAAA